MSNFTYPLPNGSGWSVIGQTLNLYTYDTFGVSVLIVFAVVAFFLGLETGRRIVDGVSVSAFVFFLTSIALSIMGWIGAQYVTAGMGFLIIAGILNMLSGSGYKLE
jgi:hypothetical protein